MILYLDASVIVSLFSIDRNTPRARAVLDEHARSGEADGGIAISDFGRLEFASAISRITRVDPRRRGRAAELFGAFDAWFARFATLVATTPADLIAGEASIRLLDTALRTGDALHIAIADRIGATIATFDHILAEAARERGVGVLS